MAYTKIHAIKATVDKAIEYICNPDKNSTCHVFYFLLQATSVLLFSVFLPLLALNMSIAGLLCLHSSSYLNLYIISSNYGSQIPQNLDARSRFMIDERQLGLLFWNAFRLFRKAALFSVFISEKVASSFWSFTFFSTYSSDCFS